MIESRISFANVIVQLFYDRRECELDALAGAAEKTYDAKIQKCEDEIRILQLHGSSIKMEKVDRLRELKKDKKQVWALGFCVGVPSVSCILSPDGSSL